MWPMSVQVLWKARDKAYRRELSWEGNGRSQWARSHQVAWLSPCRDREGIWVGGGFGCNSLWKLQHGCPGILEPNLPIREVLYLRKGPAELQPHMGVLRRQPQTGASEQQKCLLRQLRRPGAWNQGAGRGGSSQRLWGRMSSLPGSSFWPRPRPRHSWAPSLQSLCLCSHMASSLGGSHSASLNKTNTEDFPPRAKLNLRLTTWAPNYGLLCGTGYLKSGSL